MDDRFRYRKMADDLANDAQSASSSRIRDYAALLAIRAEIRALALLIEEESNRVLSIVEKHQEGQSNEEPPWTPTPDY